jgi:hypothetical protein
MKFINNEDNTEVFHSVTIDKQAILNMLLAGKFIRFNDKLWKIRRDQIVFDVDNRNRLIIEVQEADYEELFN